MSSLFQGAAAEYAARIFNADIEENETTFTAGVTALEIVKDDPERLFLMLVNLSVNAAYWSFAESVSSSAGAKLGANGGTLIMNAREDLILPTKKIFVVADGAASTIYVQYLRRFRAVER